MACTWHSLNQLALDFFLYCVSKISQIHWNLMHQHYRSALVIDAVYCDWRWKNALHTSKMKGFHRVEFHKWQTIFEKSDLFPNGFEPEKILFNIEVANSFFQLWVECSYEHRKWYKQIEILFNKDRVIEFWCYFSPCRKCCQHIISEQLATAVGMLW